MLNVMEEKILLQIVENYDESNGEFSIDLDNVVSGSANPQLVAKKLEKEGYFSNCKYYVSCITGVLESKGIKHFKNKEKEKNLKKKLITSDRALLYKINEIEQKYVDEYLHKLFEDLSQEEDLDLRDTLREMKELGHIEIGLWADNLPQFVRITRKGKKSLDEGEDLEKDAFGTTVYNINAQHGNVIIGDHGTINNNIENTYSYICNEIESKGGTDKKELKRMLDEAFEVAQEIQENSVISKKDNLLKKIGEHAKAHNWFYGAIVNLLGQAVLNTFA